MVCISEFSVYYSRSCLLILKSIDKCSFAN